MISSRCYNFIVKILAFVHQLISVPYCSNSERFKTHDETCSVSDTMDFVNGQNVA